MDNTYSKNYLWSVYPGAKLEASFWNLLIKVTLTMKRIEFNHYKLCGFVHITKMNIKMIRIVL